MIAPGLTLLEVGARRYAGEEGIFSDKNSTVAELGGEVIGMLHAFPIEGGPVAPGEERHGRLLYGNL